MAITRLHRFLRRWTTGQQAMPILKNTTTPWTTPSGYWAATRCCRGIFHFSLRTPSSSSFGYFVSWQTDLQRGKNSYRYVLYLPVTTTCCDTHTLLNNCIVIIIITLSYSLLHHTGNITVTSSSHSTASS